MKKLYKLNLAPYAWSMPGQQPEMYSVTDNLAMMLLAPDLKLDSKQALRAHQLAERILDSTESILLDEDEYERIKRAMETLKGYTWADIQLIQRITGAEQVEVEEIV